MLLLKVILRSITVRGKENGLLSMEKCMMWNSYLFKLVTFLMI